MKDNREEQLLKGGNVSQVYRSGTTVRREMKAGSENVHRLLLHLEKKGIEFTPRFLGIDEKGREVLSFIHGEAGNYPLKSYMWSDDSLIGIARMLRDYHDAVADFEIDDSWSSIDNTPANKEVICHNDFAVYNIIFNHERPVGVIDFDVVGPGPRLWDIAYSLYTCVPLSRFHLSEDGQKVEYEDHKDSAQRKKRVELFFHSYDMDIPSDVIQMVFLRLEGLCKTITRKAGDGDQAFKRMIEEGHVEHYKKDIAFIKEFGVKWIDS